MIEDASELRAAAARYGLSEQAAVALFLALKSGGGGQAQFSHPELGGMGQWSGGMTQIGDMFNDALKAKVNGFCTEMASAARLAQASDGSSRWQTASGSDPAGAPIQSFTIQGADPWWPAALGQPASSGAQNGMRYACFPDRHRLAIERDGKIVLYDTGVHRLNGFSQQQSHTTSLAFSGQNGPVPLESLRVVDP